MMDFNSRHLQSFTCYNGFREFKLTSPLPKIPGQVRDIAHPAPAPSLLLQFMATHPWWFLIGIRRIFAFYHQHIPQLHTGWFFPFFEARFEYNTAAPYYIISIAIIMMGIGRVEAQRIVYNMKSDGVRSVVIGCSFGSLLYSQGSLMVLFPGIRPDLIAWSLTDPSCGVLRDDDRWFFHFIIS